MTKVYYNNQAVELVTYKLPDKYEDEIHTMLAVIKVNDKQLTVPTNELRGI